MEFRFVYRDTESVVRRDRPGTVVVDGRTVPVPTHRGHAVRDGDTVWVRWEGRTYRLTLERPGRRGQRAGGGDLTAPMPGQVLEHLVEAGDRVEAGAPLVLMEAMKMQLEIKAPRAGTVARFLEPVGATVAGGAPLVELEPDE